MQPLTTTRQVAPTGASPTPPRETSRTSEEAVALHASTLVLQTQGGVPALLLCCEQCVCRGGNSIMPARLVPRLVLPAQGALSCTGVLLQMTVVCAVQAVATQRCG
jgi:hypothetical protein